MGRQPSGLKALMSVSATRHPRASSRPPYAVHDSVLVEVPITEKRYEAENYRATVRGFQPELVDIWVRETSTTIRVPYRKRWGFTAGPQVGIGYTPAGVQPYAGAGVTFGYSF